MKVTKALNRIYVQFTNAGEKCKSVQKVLK